MPQPMRRSRPATVYRMKPTSREWLLKLVMEKGLAAKLGPCALIVLPAALRQVARAFDYLPIFNPAADQPSDGLIAAGDSLAQFPHRGRFVPGSNLRELVTAYPYIGRYRIVRDTVRILATRVTPRAV